jgi:hypothetical protein
MDELPLRPTYVQVAAYMYLLFPSLRSFYHALKIQNIQTAPGEKINILGGHRIGHTKQKIVYEHVSYFERFPR